MTVIGIISDTHGLLRPEVEPIFRGVAAIIHAGDIGSADIVPALRAIAPVTAIRGNVDTGAWADAFPETVTTRIEDRSIHVVHDLNDLALDAVAGGIDVVVAGHSHRPEIETADGVLYLNPGSAGRRRFRLPVTVATLALGDNGLRPQLHEIST